VFRGGYRRNLLRNSPQYASSIPGETGKGDVGGVRPGPYPDWHRLTTSGIMRPMRTPLSTGIMVLLFVACVMGCSDQAEQNQAPKSPIAQPPAAQPSVVQPVNPQVQTETLGGNDVQRSPMIPAAQTDMMPETNVEYSLASPDIFNGYTDADPGPAEKAMSISWRMAIEFVFRTKLREFCESLPFMAERSEVMFYTKDRKEKVVIFTNVGKRTVSIREIPKPK
jgi:hypothetical protein